MYFPSGFDTRLIDSDALRAVARLQERGYEAYLVGGCVRDLLLGRRPKDFDIATSASPQHVRRTFPRNCRIIGRRFKLAHLHYDNNRKILEVSTFRRQPEELEDASEDDDILITRDNVFGTAREDALRRDFTVNALFHDSVKDEILDYCGGIADIERRVLRTIGDPVVRFREDPVRIVRAAKFRERLGLTIESETLDAMRKVAPDLARSAPPRLLEEILRLLRGGHALAGFQLLRDVDAIEVLIPVVHRYFEQADQDERILFWRTLEVLDSIAHERSEHAAAATRRDSSDWPPSGGLLLGALFNRPVQFAAAKESRRAPTTIAEELITPFARDYRLPRRDTGCLKRICGVQHRFTSTGARRFRTDAFLKDPYFEEALELFAWNCTASGRDLDALERWRELFAQSARNGEDLDDDGEGREPKRPSRSRKTSQTKRASRSKKAKSAKDKGATERSGKGAKERSAKAGSKKAKRGRARKETADASPRKRKAKKRKDRSSAVETLEPEAIDVSAFEVELDPKRIPTFGTIVEGTKKRKRKQVLDPEDDTYRPPPPPEDDAPSAPPPPGPDDGQFGDW